MLSSINIIFCSQLGVNGYSFMVDNNGHVLYHPDLRPLVRLTDFRLCIYTYTAYNHYK